MKNQRIEVAITDDHALVLEGLAKIITARKEFSVGIKARNGKELLEKLEKPGNLPDVLLLDINMPVMNGYETMKVIKEKYPSLKVLVISMYESEYSIIQMFCLGAKGYLEKESDSEQLYEALINIYNGKFYHSGDLSKKIMAMIQSGSPLTGITPRELEFMGWCCTELTYKEIAVAMKVGERTVHGYRDLLFEKLELKSRTGLALFALNTGIIAGNSCVQEKSGLIKPQ